MAFGPPQQDRSSRSARVSRVLASVLFGLQVLLWGGGSILEARAAAESLTRRAHVEDTGTTKCPPIHSDVDCLVCRTLSGGAVGASPPSINLLHTVADRCPDSSAAIGAGRKHHGSVGSRAPPSA
jgi:hypothetical protein